MATVYEAVDQRLETVVAVKESHLSDPHLVRQFTLEARLLAKQRHPALTRVIDHFEEGGAQFLVGHRSFGSSMVAGVRRLRRATSQIFPHQISRDAGQGHRNGHLQFCGMIGGTNTSSSEILA